MKQSEKVSIRPGVSILALLKHIEYEPWFALAEFVDNAIDSFQKYETELKKQESGDYKLKVYIEFNDTDKKITIRDNAAGIHAHDYKRAFRAAEIPPDNSGLSEFGMGMKSAACWFSDYWTVKTKALGEDFEKTVTFDLNKIFYDKIEELSVISKNSKKNYHYTIIELNKIEKMPIKKTKGKIKTHLSSIYRHFFRVNALELYVDGEILKYHDPKILSAPYPHDSKNPTKYWRQEIDLVIEKDKLFVKGFVGLLETMESGRNGFALFRRGRVIEGSGDDGFRPKEIMGEVGSPEWKRIFGELHLEGFNVTFTKKGIKWDENMEIFLDLLRYDLIQANFIRQARNYRTRPSKKEIMKTAESVVSSTVEDIKEKVSLSIQNIRSTPLPKQDHEELTKTSEKSSREFNVIFNDINWIITIELSFDSNITDWIEIGDHLLKSKSQSKNTRQIGIRMSLSHPFIEKFAGTDKSKLEPILRIAAALGLAEVTAREVGVSRAGVIRMNLNKLLSAIAE